jgi:hypothetical protein
LIFLSHIANPKILVVSIRYEYNIIDFGFRQVWQDLVNVFSARQSCLFTGIDSLWKELVSPNDNKSRLIVDRSNSIDNLLNGGLAVNLDMNDPFSNIDMKDAIESAFEIVIWSLFRMSTLLKYYYWYDNPFKLNPIRSLTIRTLKLE